MKKTALVLALSALTLLIVIPATYSVNNSTSNAAWMDRALRADGEPLPPPIPHPPSSELKVLMADGEPLPPPIPHPPSSELKVLMADGEPLPPPIPHASLGATLG